LVSTHYMDEAERCSTVGYIYLSNMLVEGRPDDLVQLPVVTPPGMRRVEAECAGGAAAVMGKARELDYVEEVTICGNSLHLLVHGGFDDRRIAGDLARAAGSEVEVRPIAPSLEDVFVRLTRMQVEKNMHGEAGRAGAARAAPAAAGAAAGT